MPTDPTSTSPEKELSLTTTRVASLRKPHARHGTGLLPYLCLAPAVALSSAVVFYPIATAFLSAFCKVNAFGVRQGFNGLENFHRLFHDEVFLHALRMTWSWTFWIVVITLVVSLAVAAALNETFRGRSLCRAVLMLPWAASLMISAIVWRWILQGNYGMFNHLLRQLHLLQHDVEWLARGRTSFPAMIYVGILVSLPFTATVFLAGLQAIPSELYEAAEVDGATGWGLFRHIALPLLRPVFVIAVVINVIHVFNSFPIVWTMTRGDPANETDVLVTYLWKLAFINQDFGTASALAVVTFIILLVFSIAYIRMYYRTEESGP